MRRTVRLTLAQLARRKRILDAELVTTSRVVREQGRRGQSRSGGGVITTSSLGTVSLRSGWNDGLSRRGSRPQDGTLISWTEISQAVSYDVVRGRLSDIVDTGVVVSLGTVTCVENDSVDESTVGHEDSDLPAHGEAFFYVVGFHDGVTGTYGVDTAGKPRAAGPGNCF